MAPITTQAQLLTKVHTSRRRLEKTIAKLTPDELQRPGVINAWSAKDILAHLADWEQRCLGWLDAVARGESPAVPAPGLTWKRADLDRLNAQIYAAHRDRPVDEVLALFRSVHAELVRRVETMSETELFTPGRFPFTGKAPFASWVNGYAGHDAWGQRHIREFVKRSKTA